MSVVFSTILLRLDYVLGVTSYYVPLMMPAQTSLKDSQSVKKGAGENFESSKF